ncbi:peptidoglycan/xylan/chitin deacetylase (PgdA/CDA1 family) [Nocardia sp. GAS34]|uniref:polysaccharide deacetylase family protein n=1 Tax=unclassified Nocardia TaxID=2637762 RepID=UPI003D1DCFB8
MFERGLTRRGLLVAGAATAAGLLSAACGTAQGSSSSGGSTYVGTQPLEAGAEPVASAVPGTLARAVAPTAPATPAMPPATTPAPALAAEVVRPPAVAASHNGQRPTAWGMDLTGITTTFVPAGKQVALTFDACGGPGNDAMSDELINYLVAQKIPATLFLNKRWIDADPGRAAKLADNPLFEIGNHGTRHCPLSVTGRAVYNIRGTASPQEAVDEVWGNHERLIQLTGRAPRFFRTGTAHYDDVAVKIVHELGEIPVGFSVNADAGATLTSVQVQRQMATVVPGAITIAHMHRPKSGTPAGMLASLPRLRTAGYDFVHLL